MELEELVEWVSTRTEISVTSRHGLIHVLKNICFRAELLSASGTADSFVFVAIGSGLGHYR